MFVKNPTGATDLRNNTTHYLVNTMNMHVMSVSTQTWGTNSSFPLQMEAFTGSITMPDFYKTFICSVYPAEDSNQPQTITSYRIEFQGSAYSGLRFYFLDNQSGFLAWVPQSGFIVFGDLFVFEPMPPLF